MSDVEEKVRTRSMASIVNYQTVFETHIGKKVLWDLIKHSGMTDFSPSMDHGELAFREGKRDVVTYILNKLKTDAKKMEAIIDRGVKDEYDIFEQS